MAPKKAKKIALSEFLGDSALGSWADEVEQLPSAPAPKMYSDDGPNDRESRYGGRRDDGPRPDRPGFAREDVPLPSKPPYTAFVGNLAFDLGEDDIANHFSDLKIATVKVIKDRDDRPKGFGYVEFQSLDDLKEAITRSGTSLAGRTIRVSVAEPPKERSGFGGGGDDDGKFDNPWRRDGPLPDLPGRDGGRRRFDSADRPERVPSVTDGVSDWRSSRPPRAAEPEPPRRKFSSNFGNEGAADKEETWSKGSRFQPSEEGGSRFGGSRQRAEPPASVADEGDWRGSSRPARAFVPRGAGSPSDSTPSTPQMGRRKLELLPRSGPVSSTPSPIPSPKSAAPRANPFGAAKPVDVSQREKEVEQKLERERESIKERAPMSRTTSRTASERNPGNRVSSPTPSQARSPASPKPAPSTLSSTVRPTISFANAASSKKDQATEGDKKET